ncbi:B2 bradykinin receptor-like [Eleutherodactylus coqui]|uniref:B2 bradykinin receptor-like n=1 Tax=Eleutherodactylus coqui TaxID=57060 RepID=UPI0034622C67
MMSEEFNATRIFLASTREPPQNVCMSMDQFQWLSTYQPPYMWFIFVLGFIENLFVISVFILHKNRCTVAEIYLGNMVFSDLILVSSLPFWATTLSNNFYWPFGSFLCKAISSMVQINVYSSIYFLMMVSVDRYLALVKTMSIGRLRRPRWAKVNCATIWIFATLLTSPTMVLRRAMFNEFLNTTACLAQQVPGWNLATKINLNILGFLVPLVIIAFCTFQIISVLRNNAMQQFKEVNKEKKATWLVLAVLLVFIVCWLPFHISTFLDIMEDFNVFPPCTVDSFNHVFTQISTYIAYSNSCINPVMYIMVGNHFRKKAKEVYTRLLCRGSERRKLSFPTVESTNLSQISSSMERKNKSIA